jgi:hypothetical protein
MKHGTKELLKTIISNQELMMKALNIQPVKKEASNSATKLSKKDPDTKVAAKASTSTATKAPAKPAAKKAVKKTSRK